MTAFDVLQIVIAASTVPSTGIGGKWKMESMLVMTTFNGLHIVNLSEYQTLRMKKIIIHYRYN